MVRNVLVSCFCFLMTTSLLAQETAAAAAPEGPAQGNRPAKAAAAPKLLSLKKGTEVNLVLLENLSSATAVKGQTVRYAVAKDVFADDLVAGGVVVVIPRGAEATGVVGAVRKGIKGKQDGYLAFGPEKVALADGTWVELKDHAPGQETCDEGMCGISALPLAVIYYSTFFLVSGVTSLFRPHDKSGQKNVEIAGTNTEVKACLPEAMYTGAKSRLTRDPAQVKPPAALADLESLGGCPLPPPGRLAVAH